MMSAVRKEAMALDDMKIRMAEMEELKVMVPELKFQVTEAEHKKTELERALRDSDKLYMQLKNDMQRLNDLYNNERKAHLETQNANMALDTEMVRLQQETVFLQRESEKVNDFRKKVQVLQQQLNQSEEGVEELKKAAQRNILAMKKKYDDLEVEKQTQLELLSKTSDELDISRNEVRRLHDEKSNMQQMMVTMREQANTSVETLRKQIDSHTQREDSHIQEFASLQSELRKMKDLLQAKTESIEQLMLKLKTSEEGRQGDKQEQRNKFIELNDTISHLKSQNHMLERQSADALHKLGLISSDISRYQADCERFRSESEQKDNLYAQKESLIAQQMQQLAISRDENLSRYATAAQQAESLQQQLRDLHQKHWEDLQRTKENEASIAEETDALQQELHEKSLQVIALEAEKAKIEEYVNGEVLNASQLSQTLRTELEKRIEELTLCKKERDLLAIEKNGLLDKINDFDSVLKRNDALFKQTLENDRAKIQQEVRTKLTRLKALESDKQELLRETNELVTQLAELRKEKHTLTQQCGEWTRKFDDVASELEAINSARAVLEKKLNDSTSKERDLTTAITMMESQFRAQSERLEQAVKDSKKEAAQQVVELSNQVKYLSNEVESLQHRNKDLDNSEKKAWAEANRLRGDLDEHTRNNDRQQQSIADEFTTLKRENRDMKLRMSVTNESKTKSDMEIVSMQTELSKQETEIGKLTDTCREMENKLSHSEEQIHKITNELKTVSDTYARCRVRNVELEEALAQKMKLLDKQGKDMAKMEREGVSEVKRLKVLLANTERELEELKPQVFTLQKEVQDGRVSIGKLQTSSNSTVNGLLEELRSTEDALANERKRSMQEVETYHTKIADLQGLLDRAKEALDESANRSKAEKTEKVRMRNYDS
jgi:chromosome segregation ATPase